MTPYYEDTRAGITIYHGDCREVLPTLGPVDHVITDPPYEAEAHTKGRRVTRPNATTELQDKWAWHGTHGTVRYASLDFDAITDELRLAVSREFARLTKRWTIVFSQAEGAHKWEAAQVAAGLNRRRWAVWVKPGAQPQFSGDRPGVGYETILMCHQPGRSTWNGGGRVGVFTHIGARGIGHMAAKPLRLMAELVSLFTDPGETILDPFMGSGTTLRAAKDLHRRAIGIEIEERWCEVAAKRLSQEVLAIESEEKAGAYTPAPGAHAQEARQ
jgi:site-specific DNA-methyltransferase (adenine-specific)